MHVLVSLGSLVLGQALCDLLMESATCIPRMVQTLEQDETYLPDLILADASSLVQKLSLRWPAAKLVLLDTGLEENQVISILLSCRLQGVIAPDTDTHLFLKALSVIQAGQIWIDNSKLKSLLNHAGNSSYPTTIDKISRKEKEVMILVSQGLKNKEIADRLSISEQTVKAHLSNIFRKVKVSTRSQLVPLAMQFQASSTAHPPSLH